MEYKTCSEKISETLYETVCSFLNHGGGHIIMGVKDDGEVVGVNPDKAETLKANIITSIKNRELFLPSPYFTPQIMEVHGKSVILLDVPCGQYVYRYKGHYWDRNGDADIDVTNNPELLLTLFERKNPHLFEERVVNDLKMEHLDPKTFQYCRNILATTKPEHPWIQLSDEEILFNTRLARKGELSNGISLKYAALILFGNDDAIQEFLPRYRFEAMFHMCTYERYNDVKHFPNRYDDRRTMRCNLIKVYDQLIQFTERYLPDKFYLPPGTTQRVDIRHALFREIVANLCVHSDFNSGYACFYHVFKDRVVTKNPTRLLPEIPEGKLTLGQLGNYTKNPLLVRVFHELSWVEDMGSGTRNIMRYAPLYFPNYNVEIINGSQFIFSLTYMETPPEDVTTKERMSPENVTRKEGMSPEEYVNLDEEELRLYLEDAPSDKKTAQKKRKRQQGIIRIISQTPSITVEDIAERLGAHKRTIMRDMEELKNIIEHTGPNKGGEWRILSRKDTIKS